MKLYLALIITLCHISLTLVKGNTKPKVAAPKILLIGNDSLYCINATKVSKAVITEKLTNRKTTDYRFLKILHLDNEKPCDHIF